ncbi:hypothetical protein [Sinorhizobium sp. Sb3]|uniref:hypothetical protein n=1 Tax=Sinorhizobium sp. Sb3 TaxID=1358417 RepID=UPI000AC984A2|nr:hypothetical protein [Sinorhizobium sp. Sb3]
MVSRRLDDRLGKELGLTGRYADVPALQIVNDAHDQFLSLTSRLVGLEYGPNGDACKSHPSWPAINIETSGLAGSLSALGNDAVRAAASWSAPVQTPMRNLLPNTDNWDIVANCTSSPRHTTKAGQACLIELREL